MEQKVPQNSPQKQDQAVPQDRDVAPQNDAFTPGVRRIMELVGETSGEISEAQRREIHQELHDLIILEDAFFTIYDLPINPKWVTPEIRRVFFSANTFKKKRMQSQEAGPRNPPGTSSQKEANQGAIGQAHASRPTRQNTKAPDIPPTPSVSIERQLRKELPK